MDIKSIHLPSKPIFETCLYILLERGEPHPSNRRGFAIREFWVQILSLHSDLRILKSFTHEIENGPVFTSNIKYNEKVGFLLRAKETPRHLNQPCDLTICTNGQGRWMPGIGAGGAYNGLLTTNKELVAQNPKTRTRKPIFHEEGWSWEGPK